MSIKVEVSVIDETSQIQLNILTPLEPKSHKKSLPSSQHGYPSSSSSDTSSEPSHINISRSNARSRKNRWHSTDLSELSDESPVVTSDIAIEFDNLTMVGPSNYQPSTVGDHKSQRDGDVEGTTLYESQTETESSLPAHAYAESGDQPLAPHNSPVARPHILRQPCLVDPYEGLPEMMPASAYPSTHRHHQPEASSSAPHPNLSSNALPQHPIMPSYILRSGSPYGCQRQFATPGLGVPVPGGPRTVDERWQFMHPSFVEYLEVMSHLQESLANAALGDEDVPAGWTGCVRCGKREGSGRDEVGR